MMETPPVQQKPREARLATNLLWISLGIGPVNFALQFDYLQSQASTGFVFTVSGITFVVVGVLIYFISTGRNWARITFLVLFLVGLTQAISQLTATFDRSTLTGLLSLGQALLQIVALYLIFSRPGASWFAKRVKP